jgi:hypothetical protein
MPNFAQNRQAVMNILSDLLRPVGRELRVIYNQPLPFEQPSFAMSFESAITEMKNVVDGKPAQFMIPGDYSAKLRKAGINRSIIDLVLTEDFLRPYKILITKLKFDIDEAHALLQRLTQQQIAGLDAIAQKQLPQFLSIYRLLHVDSSNSYGDTIANLLSILQQVDADMKPWHVTEIFSAKHMVIYTKQMMANIDYLEMDIEGVDQCNRRSFEMSERIYPQAQRILTEVLKFSESEAKSITAKMNQFEIVEILPYVLSPFRDLLKEILFVVSTQHINADQALKIIRKHMLYPAFHFEFITASDNSEHMTMGMVMVSSGMFKIIDLSAQALSSDKNLAIAKINSIVAQLFVELEEELTLTAVRARDCNPIRDCVVPFKLDLLTDVKVMGLLGLPKDIVRDSTTSIARSIATDLRSCGREFFDYPRITPEYDILKRSYVYMDRITSNFSGFTSINPPLALLDALTTQELLAKDHLVSPISQLFNDYESYTSALEQCSIFYNATVNGNPANRRLLATNNFADWFPSESPSKSIFQTITNSIADFVYDWLGKPILDAVVESPTYFPPQQPNLWTQNSSVATSKFGLFNVSRSHYSMNIVPPISTPSVTR